MRVGIDGNPLFSFSGNLNGIGQFSKHLIEACLEQESDIDFEITRLLMPHRKFVPPLKEYSNLSYRVARWIPPVIYYQSFKRLPWVPPYDLILFRKYDAFIFFNFVTYPLSKSTKSLLFVHDLSYIRYPEYTSPKNRVYMEKFVPRSIKQSTRVITISEFSKKEICEYYKVPEDKVSVVTPAVDHTVFYPRDYHSIDVIRKKYNIKDKYILSVCTLEPRKNLLGVLDAYEMLPDKIKSGFTLVLAGGKGWLDEELDTKIKNLSSKYDIVRTGYVPDEDLPILYSGASVFVFPSFYEGFGMPVLEAMACGTPVITSNNSSLPEVVDNAGIMIDAKDSTKLAKDIDRVLTDTKLAKELRDKGIAQARKFSWDKSAKKMLKILKDIEL